MEKYLFNDGTNVIREVESKKELEALIASAADASRVRIWRFNSSEWLSLPAFEKTEGLPAITKVILPVPENENRQHAILSAIRPVHPYLRKGIIAILLAIGIFLVYNFTRVSWSSADTYETNAARADNVPVMDMDSLIQSIEWSRGRPLDKTTATNLRIRNTWPDRMQLKVSAARDTSTTGSSRFHDPQFSIDNSTGYEVDEAIVTFTIFNKGDRMHSDTLRFTQVGYAYPSTRTVTGEFRGDSIAAAYLSIRARSFNFCYSSGKESNYGNLADRWFCRD